MKSIFMVVVVCAIAAGARAQHGPGSKSDEAPAPGKESAISKLRVSPAGFTSGSSGDLWLDAHAPDVTYGAQLIAHSDAPNVFARLGTTGTSSQFVVFNSANTELLRVRSDGRVGIGASIPESLLHLSGPSGASTITFTNVGSQRFRVGAIKNVDNWGASTLNADYTTGGWVLDNPAFNGWFFKLDGRGTGADTNSGLWLYLIPPGAGAHAGDERPMFGVGNGGAYFREHMSIGLTSPPSAPPSAALSVNGDVSVIGSVAATGNIAAKYQDVAEWVPVSEKVLPGTVVVVSDMARNMVGPSSTAYDTRVAGVVSTQPGVILGEPSASKAQIATTGRVLVRVDATAHPIHAGDLLVTSDKPGLAMRSEPVDLGAVKLHRPGTLIGKALEPLTRGEGEILVLLSLQ